MHTILSESRRHNDRDKQKLHIKFNCTSGKFYIADEQQKIQRIREYMKL